MSSSKIALDTKRTEVHIVVMSNDMSHLEEAIAVSEAILSSAERQLSDKIPADAICRDCQRTYAEHDWQGACPDRRDHAVIEQTSERRTIVIVTTVSGATYTDSSWYDNLAGAKAHAARINGEEPVQ